MKPVFKLYNNIENISHLIFYGQNGIGKYTQALSFIKQYSPSNLKYERKININLSAKKEYFKVSDIHIEVDMELLGCNTKVYLMNYIILLWIFFLLCKINTVYFL